MFYGGELCVALRKESVDRNACDIPASQNKHKVALRKESVDRNNAGALSYDEEKESLSARRAWIEIKRQALHFVYVLVALRKESVDRNLR